MKGGNSLSDCGEPHGPLSGGRCSSFYALERRATVFSSSDTVLQQAVGRRVSGRGSPEYAGPFPALWTTAYVGLVHLRGKLGSPPPRADDEERRTPLSRSAVNISGEGIRLLTTARSNRHSSLSVSSIALAREGIEDGVAGHRNSHVRHRRYFTALPTGIEPPPQ